MKIQIFTSLLLLMTATLKAENPPESIIKALNQKFPSAINIKWQKLKDYNWWQASFSLNNKKATASFTFDARWIESTLEISPNELLEKVKSAAKRDHPGCQILYGIIIETSGLGTGYKVKLKCGGKEIEATYDYQGWEWPPRIS